MVYWLKTKYNLDLIIILLCLFPLFVIAAVIDGNISFSLLSIEIFVYILIFLLLFIRLKRYEFYDIYLTEKKFFHFKKNREEKIIFYKDIFRCQYYSTVKGNYSLIIHYLRNGNSLKEFVNLRYKKVLLFKERMQEMGYDKIKFEIEK